MMYNNLVESCFFSPVHSGTLDLMQPLTIHYRKGEAGRGDVLDFYLACDKKGNILQARFKVYGNPYLIAAAEWLCRQLEKSQLEEHPKFDHRKFVEEFAIPRNRYAVALQIEDGYRELILMMKTKLKEETR